MIPNRPTETRAALKIVVCADDLETGCRAVHRVKRVVIGQRGHIAGCGFDPELATAVGHKVDGTHGVGDRRSVEVTAVGPRGESADDRLAACAPQGGRRPGTLEVVVFVLVLHVAAERVHV